MTAEKVTKDGPGLREEAPESATEATVALCKENSVVLLGYKEYTREPQKSDARVKAEKIVIEWVIAMDLAVPATP